MQQQIKPLTSNIHGQATSLRVLMYHHVGPYEEVKEQRGLHCNVERFARQMAFLERSSLNVISMDRALEALEGRSPLAGPGIVLTFDDGFQDFHDHAWPILKAHNFPATMYAISNLLGKTQNWGTRSAIADDRLMDAATLRTLANDGLDVGGHTAHHPHLDTLPLNQRDAEIADGKKQLEDALGHEVRHFAYPYGHYDADARDRVAAAGYRSAVTTIRNRAERAANSFEIPRQGVSNRDGIYRFRRKTHWRYNCQKSIPIEPIA